MTLLERLKKKSKEYPDLASHSEGLKKTGHTGGAAGLPDRDRTHLVLLELE